MTIHDIQRRVDAIRRLATEKGAVCSFGVVFGEEIDLWRDTLKAIAAGESCPRSLAEACLKTSAIPFPRDLN